MDNLSSKMTLSECLQHFDVVEDQEALFTVYTIGCEAPKWFECRVCCSIDGVELKKGDLILIDPANGEIKGLFREFVTVKEALKNA